MKFLKILYESLLLVNPTVGSFLQLTNYHTNLQRWSSVEKKGIFYLMESFCLNYLGNKVRGKENSEYYIKNSYLNICYYNYYIGSKTEITQEQKSLHRADYYHQGLCE